MKAKVYPLDLMQEVIDGLAENKNQKSSYLVVEKKKFSY